jgi:hypothetical protein
MAANLGLQMFVLIYFQRLGIPVGRAVVSLPLIVVGIALLVLAVRGGLAVSRARLVLFAATGTLAAASQALAAGPISIESLGLLLATYLIYTVRLELDLAAYLALCRRFSAFMILPALIVCVQYAYQLHAGPGNSLSLDRLVPRALLLPGYVYESSTEFWRTWDRPNGIFFLEPSFCSAFLAFAFVNEALLLRRRGYALFFLAALTLCSGATGLLLAGIAIAWELRRSRSAVAAGVTALVVLTSLTVLGVGPTVLDRVAELGQPTSSGYERLVLPLRSLLGLVGDPRGWLTGNGAGQITEDFGNAWPIVKLVYEYGFPTAVAWMALFGAAVWGWPNVGFRIAVFVVFQFTGGYLLSPIMALFAYLTCTVCTVVPPAAARRPAGLQAA